MFSDFLSVVVVVVFSSGSVILRIVMPVISMVVPPSESFVVPLLLHLELLGSLILFFLPFYEFILGLFIAVELEIPLGI